MFIYRDIRKNVHSVC